MKVVHSSLLLPSFSSLFLPSLSPFSFECCFIIYLPNTFYCQLVPSISHSSLVKPFSMPVFFVPLLMFPLLWSSLLPHLSLIFRFLIPIIPCCSNLIKYYWRIWHLDKLRNFYHRYQKSIFKLFALLSHKPFDFLS